MLDPKPVQPLKMPPLFDAVYEARLAQQAARIEELEAALRLAMVEINTMKPTIALVTIAKVAYKALKPQETDT